MYSCFDYYPLIWQFCSCKLASIIEQIKKGFLRIVFNDNERVYETLTKNIYIIDRYCISFKNFTKNPRQSSTENTIKSDLNKLSQTHEF